MSNAILFRLAESNCLVGIVEDATADAWLCSAIAVVRYWGTTAGFPQLCSGPTPKTIIDVAPMPEGALAEVLRSAVLYTLPADESAWRRALGCE